MAAEAEFQVQRRVSPPLRAGPADPPQTEDCHALLPPQPQPLPSQHGLLVGGGCAAFLGPEDDLSHPRDPQRGRGGGCCPCGLPSAGDPTVFPAAQTRGLPLGEGQDEPLDSRRPLPRWRMEQSTSWRPSTPCRSTRGWLTSRAAQTPGETPGMGRRGGGGCWRGCALGGAFTGSSFLVRAGAELEKWALLTAVQSRWVLAGTLPVPTPPVPAGSVVQGPGAWRAVESSCSHSQGRLKPSGDR